MKVISLINVKGGVGKTMTTINLAGQLDYMGYKVLLVDNDSQSSLTQILNVQPNEHTLYNLYDDDKVSVEDCIVKFSQNISVIPNTIESALLESELHSRQFKESQLKNKFSLYNGCFDFILIDNSPFLGLLVQNSFTMSDYYLPVIDNSPSALQGLNMIDRVIKKLNDNNLALNIKLIGILRNRFEKKSLFTAKFTKAVEEQLREHLFKTIIYDSVKYKEASAKHTIIQDYSDKHAEPYKQLYYEMIDSMKYIDDPKSYNPFL